MDVLTSIMSVLAALCFLAAAVRYSRVTLDLVALGLFFWVIPQMVQSFT